VLEVPLHLFSGEVARQWLLRDLWSGDQHYLGAADLDRLRLTIAPDFSPGGGFRVLRLSAVI